MADRSFRQDVDDRLASINFSPELRGRILAAVQEEAQPVRRRAPRWRKAAIVSVAACLALVFGVAAAMAVFPSFERLVAGLGDGVAGMLAPVGVSATADGIRMEVVAAVNTGDGAVVYVNVEDTQGDRVDEGTVLVAPSIGDAFVIVENAFYEDGIATFALRTIGPMETSGKLELAVEGLLLGETEFERVDIGLTLADVVAENPQPDAGYRMAGPEAEDEYWSSGYAIGYDETGVVGEEMMALLENDEMPILMPGTLARTLDAPAWFDLSAAGMVGDWLHVQTAWREDASRLGSLGLSLDWGQDIFDQQLANAQLDVDHTGSYGYGSFYRYREFIFQLPEGVAAEDIRITANGVTYEALIEQEWKMRFTIEQEPDGYLWEGGFEVDGWHVDAMRLSNTGLTLFSSEDRDPEGEGIRLEVVLKNGDTVQTSYAAAGGRFSPEGDMHYVTDGFAILTELDDVDYVIVNDVEFHLEDARRLRQ